MRWIPSPRSAPSSLPRSSGFPSRPPPTRASSPPGQTASSSSKVGERSGVLCLETDEATEHAPQIEAKLAIYERVLADRTGWHIVFVVPTPSRLTWLRRVARPDLTGRGWAVVLADLESDGLDAPVVPLGRSGQPRPLCELITDPRPRRSSTPVASYAWIELLGSGGGEDLDEVLR
jgi:hypothetical protein